jgi:hypothetical protein
VDFREQATLVYANLKAATESVAKWKISFKLSAFLTDIRALFRSNREVHDKFVNVVAPQPAPPSRSRNLRVRAHFWKEAIAVLRGALTATWFAARIASS